MTAGRTKKESCQFLRTLRGNTYSLTELDDILSAYFGCDELRGRIKSMSPMVLIYDMELLYTSFEYPRSVRVGIELRVQSCGNAYRITGERIEDCLHLWRGTKNLYKKNK